MKNLIKTKIMQSSHLNLPTDSKSIDIVLNMLVDKELLDNEEIADALKNDKNFAELVIEALQTAEEEN